MTIIDVLNLDIEYDEAMEVHGSSGNTDLVIMIIQDVPIGPVNMTYEHDTWTCCQCGGTNAGWTSDFCPACGHYKCAYCG